MEITSEKAAAKIQRRSSPRGGLFTPYEPISRRTYLIAVFTTLAIIFGIWAFLSYSGIVHPSFFLPTPTQVLVTGIQMVQSGELAENAQASIVIIISGWAIAGGRHQAGSARRMDAPLGGRR